MSKTANQVDLIHGSVFKSLILFALPIFASSIFQQIYNTVDTIIVGYTLGETSIAAMGASSPIYDLVLGFALGIGNGLAIVTARSFGFKKEQLLKKSVACSIVIGAVITVVLTTVAQLGMYPLLEILNTPAEIIEESYSYISTITWFLVVMFAYNLCAGLLRAIGNSLMPLVFLIISSLLNIVLDLLFIIEFNMGVRGAAVATVIAQGVSVVLSVIYIVRKTKILLPKKEHFEPDKRMYMELLSQGLSMGFMSCIVLAGTLVIQPGINGLGYLTIAGHTAARKLFSVCCMPISSMAQAINTFTAQNRGADQKKRILQAVKFAHLFDAAFGVLLTVVVYFAAPFMVTLISGSSEPVIITNSSRYLRCAALFLWALGLLSNSRMALQGLGQKIRPLVSSVIELVGKIVFASLLIPRLGYTAVIFCEPVIWCFMAAYLVYSFYTDPYIRSKH